MAVHPEHTRTRVHGTRVFNSSDFPDPGLARIGALRKIVERRTYGKIDGCMVDLFSANAVITVYDALSPDNQKKLRDLSIGRMATVSFKFIKVSWKEGND